MGKKFSYKQSTVNWMVIEKKREVEQMGKNFEIQVVSGTHI